MIINILGQVTQVAHAQTRDTASELAPGFHKCFLASAGNESHVLACYEKAYEYWQEQVALSYIEAHRGCEQLAKDTSKCITDLEDAYQAWERYTEVMKEAVPFLNNSEADSFSSKMLQYDFLIENAHSQAKLLAVAFVHNKAQRLKQEAMHNSSK